MALISGALSATACTMPKTQTDQVRSPDARSRCRADSPPWTTSPASQNVALFGTIWHSLGRNLEHMNSSVNPPLSGGAQRCPRWERSERVHDKWRRDNRVHGLYWNDLHNGPPGCQKKQEFVLFEWAAAAQQQPAVARPELGRTGAGAQAGRADLPPSASPPFSALTPDDPQPGIFMREPEMGRTDHRASGYPRTQASPCTPHLERPMNFP